MKSEDQVNADSANPETENSAAVTESAPETTPELTGEKKAAQMKKEMEAMERQEADEKAASIKKAEMGQDMTPQQRRNLEGRLDFMIKRNRQYEQNREILATAGYTSHHKVNIYTKDIEELKAVLAKG